MTEPGGKVNRVRYNPPMLLAGDIGATKTLIGLFTRAPARPSPVEIRTFSTAAHAGLETILEEFFRGRPGGRPAVESAAFGVAGPTDGRVAELTNVPWRVDTGEIARLFGFLSVSLLNDLQAMAYSVPVLEER